MIKSLVKSMKYSFIRISEFPFLKIGDNRPITNRKFLNLPPHRPRSSMDRIAPQYHRGPKLEITGCGSRHIVEGNWPRSSMDRIEVS